MEKNKLTLKERQDLCELVEKSSHPKVRGIHNRYSPRVRAIVRDMYDTKRYLTVGETAIWLDLHPDTVYQYIKNGYIVAFRLGSDKSNWFVDVEATKEKFKNC